MVRVRCTHLQLKVRLSSAAQQNRASWEARMASQEDLSAINLSDPVPGPRETRLEQVSQRAVDAAQGEHG